MEISKNKDSGKFFIFIHDSGNNEGLFVTPSCEILSIKQDFFYEPEVGDESYFISQNLISKEQIERYAQYEKDRSEEIVDNFRYMFEQLTDNEKQQLLIDLRKV